MNEWRVVCFALACICWFFAGFLKDVVRVPRIDLGWVGAFFFGLAFLIPA